MNLSLLGFFILLETIDALKCLHCSTKSRKCDNVQQMSVCRNDDEDMCYSLRHNMKYLDRNVTLHATGHQKGCGDSRRGCQYLCNWYLANGFKFCQVDCCFGNLCNKNTVVIHRNKRLANTSAKLYTDWFILLSSFFIANFI